MKGKHANDVYYWRAEDTDTLPQVEQQGLSEW